MLEDIKSAESPEQEDQKLREAAKKSEAETANQALEIRKLLNNSGEYLSDDVQNRLEMQINRNNLSPEELKKVRQEITNRTNYFRQWQGRLEGMEDIFATDKNLGTTFEQHKQNFLDKPVDEQADILRNLDGLIQNYQNQFDQLFDIFGGQRKVPKEILEEFKARGRNKRTEFLGSLNDTTKAFENLQKSENWQKLSKQEQQKEIELFKNLGIDARRLHLKQLEKNLRPCDHDHAFNCFQELDKSQKLGLTSNIDQFPLLSHREKAQTIGRIRSKLIKIIENKYAPYRHLLSNKDLDGINSYLPRTKNEDLPAWYLNADRAIADANETDRLAKDMEPEILKHFDWDNLFTHQRLQLLQNGTMEKYKNHEHMSLEIKYFKKLDKYCEYGGYGLINKEGKKAYQDWYRNLTLKEKNFFLQPEKNYLEQTLEQRTKNVDQFLELPEPIQKEYQNKFRKADFEERTEMIAEITSDLEECNLKFDQKVDDMVSSRLLAPKSAESYKDWYHNKLKLKDKQRYLSKSDLDKPERQKFLNLFEQITNSPAFKELSAKQQKKHNEEFTNADLEDRIELIKDLGAKYLDDPETGVKTKDLVKQIETKDKFKTNTLELFADETDMLIDEAEDYEDDGKYEKAKDSYEAALEHLDKEADPIRAQELQAKINEMEDLQRILDGIESENPLYSKIDHEINQQLKNPRLEDALQHFTIMYMAYKAVKNSEIQTKAYTAQDRVHNGLRQLSTDNIIDLDNEISELTNNENQITKDADGRLALTETINFNGGEYADPTNPDYNPDIVKSLAKLQSTSPAERRMDKLRFIKDDGQEEINSKAFYLQKVIPAETNIKETMIENIANDMSGNMPDSPIIQKALQKLIGKRVNAMASRRLTVTLSVPQ